MASTNRERYDALASIRTPFLDRARECAKLTIPSMLPPSGHSGYSRLPTPWQSLGAQCVNNLSAKLLLTLFPPSAPFFKFTIDDFALERITKQKGMRGEVEKTLSKIERSITAEIETSSTRPALFEVLKHLVNEGNVLLYEPDEGPPRVYRLDRYVVKRDPMGNVLEIITHEKISELELTPAVRAALGDQAAKAGKGSGDDLLDLYTRIVRTATGFRLTQEITGKVVSRGTYTKEKNPWRALRLVAIDNEDYGRGLVEEYLGDFKSLEALTKAITQGAAAAAKVLFLVKPNGTTKKSAITQAESGAVREGNKDDVTVLQMDKYADFKVALEMITKLEQRLSRAFLLNSSIQRQGERVTAEEIRYMAQELETGLGGIYSNLSQELQLPMVVLLMDRLERQKRLPTLPRKYIKPAITTGLDAIGRGTDRTRLTGFVQTLKDLDPRFAARIKEEEFVKRIAASDGIDTEGLLKTQEEFDAEQQQAQQQAMIEKLGPNAVTQLGGLMKQGTTPSA